MPRARSSFVMTGTDLMLYAGVIWGWSTSWYAIKHQLGTVSPEVSVFWRFLLTFPLMFALSISRKDGWRFPRALHPMLALTGVLMFSTNFILFYYAGGYLPSGMLAVIFSLASILNLVLGTVLMGERFNLKLALGGLLGVLGVVALFRPQLAAVADHDMASTGLMLGAFGILCFSLGNQVSARLQRHGARVLPAAAWGMVYGTGFAAFYGLVRGQSFAVPLDAGYLSSLVFLILSATILAFYTYLSLISRIGTARASYATVIFPVFALLISTVMEGYHWSLWTVLGVGLAILGNLVILHRGSDGNS